MRFLFGMVFLLSATPPISVQMKADPIENTSKLTVIDYKQCLDTDHLNLLKYDPNDKDLFPLLRFKDEDIFPIRKTACAIQRTALLKSSIEKDLINFQLNYVEEKIALELPFIVRRQRANLKELASMIRTPGPRNSIVRRQAYFDSDDYPPEAFRKKESGIVVATFLIGKDGKVTQCSATGASDLLNSQTCAVITRRALYFPALGADQKPAHDIRTQNVRWFAPEE